VETFVNSDTREQDVLAWAEALNRQSWGIYFAINPLKDSTRSKARKVDVLEARWLWVDCDPSNGLTDIQRDEWRKSKLAELRAGKDGIPPPTLIIASGRGYWAFWRLLKSEPVDGYGPATARVEAYGRILASVLEGDLCSTEIARIARLPGFINHKTGTRACVVEHHPERVYSLDDFPRPIESIRRGGEHSAEVDGDLTNDEAAQTRVIEYLKHEAPTAIEGQRGRRTTMLVLQRCQDFGCDFDTSIELMEEHWNDRCSPPWAPGEIAYSLRDLRRNDPIGVLHPEFVVGQAFEGVVPVDPTPSQSTREAKGDGAAPEALVNRFRDESFRLRWHGDDDDEPLKEWLVEKMLPKSGRALISGQWGAFKTFAAFDLVGAVITKTAFAGRKVNRQGGVLWFAAEGQDEVRLRLAGLANAKLKSVIQAGTELPLDAKRLPFAWAENCPVLSAPSARDQLRAVVAAAAKQMMDRHEVPLAVILIDTMMAAAGFKDANDAAEAQRVMKVLGDLAFEFGVLVVVVDHFGKDQAGGTRNSSAKEDNADAVLALLGERATNGRLKNTRLAIRKCRGAAAGAETPFSTRAVTVWGKNQSGGVEPTETLVIEWGVEKASSEARHRGGEKRLSKSLTIFLDAARLAAEKSGLVAGEDGSRCVPQTAVRQEFNRLYLAKNDRAKAERYRKCVVDALARHLIRPQVVNGESLFWMPPEAHTNTAP
jgi:hypothetical protein